MSDGQSATSTSNRSDGDIEYRCRDCGTVRFPPGGGYKGVRHRIHCLGCGTMTPHQRTDYDPDAERPARAEQERAEAQGWRVNDDGNLVIGGQDADGDEADDA